MLRRPSIVFLAVLTTSKPGWVQAGCEWTRTRRKSCGLAPSFNCWKSTFKTCQSLQHPSKSSTQHTILEWWSTVVSGLTMSDHVTAVCRSAYYQLRQLRTIARSLSDDAAKTLVLAFISCRLEYCNALLCDISDGLVQCLQSVQNAAARLVTGAGRREHITPVLRQLHWLPVRHRMDSLPTELR